MPAPERFLSKRSAAADASPCGTAATRFLQQAVATDPHPYRELTTAASTDHHLWESVCAGGASGLYCGTAQTESGKLCGCIAHGAARQ